MMESLYDCRGNQEDREQIAAMIFRRDRSDEKRINLIRDDLYRLFIGSRDYEVVTDTLTRLLQRDRSRGRDDREADRGGEDPTGLAQADRLPPPEDASGICPQADLLPARQRQRAVSRRAPRRERARGSRLLRRATAAGDRRPPPRPRLPAQATSRTPMPGTRGDREARGELANMKAMAERGDTISPR